MHQALTTISANLEKVIVQLNSAIPNDEPFGNAHSNWGFPGLTRSELIEEAQSIVDLITDQDVDDLGDHEARVKDYVRRLKHLQQYTIPQLWSNAPQAVPAYLFTLQGLRKALTPVMRNDGHAVAAAQLKRLTRQIRSMEAQVNALEPRAGSLDAMVARIEQACEAADQLPTDLESLQEARQKISEIAAVAAQDQDSVSRVREAADEIDLQLKKSVEDARAVLERCETAYSAATSVGLAAAFSERSAVLSKSMWVWVAGLVGALIAGGYFGSGQLRALSELFKVPDASASVIVLNLVLSVLSVSAPVWFAWLATKQVGQRFRLAEDYAFKASISRAYEGFRREAARVDKDMETKLLASALARFDELPLRLIETASHGSPWHELASSDVVRRAMKISPSFIEKVKELASQTIGSISPSMMPQGSKSKGDLDKGGE